VFEFLPLFGTRTCCRAIADGPARSRSGATLRAGRSELGVNAMPLLLFMNNRLARLAYYETADDIWRWKLDEAYARQGRHG